MSLELINAVRRNHEARQESLLAVDEGVLRIVRRLRAEGELKDTYLVFASDNGYFLGEHRYPAGKFLHYENVSKVQLLIRGPDAGGAVEMYDLVTDPHEVKNLARRPGLSRIRQRLHGDLAEVRSCAGAGCR